MQRPQHNKELRVFKEVKVQDAGGSKAETERKEGEGVVRAKSHGLAGCETEHVFQSKG